MRTQLPAKIALVAVVLGIATVTAQQQQGDGQSFRFRSAVELINVTATVTDEYGRFVPGMRREDFRIFEDGVEQRRQERAVLALVLAADADRRGRTPTGIGRQRCLRGNQRRGDRPQARGGSGGGGRAAEDHPPSGRGR